MDNCAQLVAFTRLICLKRLLFVVYSNVLWLLGGFGLCKLHNLGQQEGRQTDKQVNRPLRLQARSHGRGLAK